MKEAPKNWTVIGFLSPANGAVVEAPGSIMTTDEAIARSDVSFRYRTAGKRRVIEIKAK